PGQSSRVLIVDPASGESRCVFESDSVLVEAPNWTSDGASLVLNADGLLWRLPVDGHDLAEIPMPGVPEINNDHVLTPDGLTFVTSDASADDGAEFTPDGRWLWFNTERFTSDPGHAQLARVRVDGSDLSRVVESGSVDWFPHPAPDGRSVAYLSYEAGTLGH